jgi:hypothetical protein
VLDLSILRIDWDEFEKGEHLPIEITTIQERLDQWAGIQMDFNLQLQDTAELFERDRWAAQIELQARLLRLSRL